MALRVLLADNSETIKKVIQLTLQDFGLDLRIVTVGVDVIDVATQFKPDIIFVDILLQKKSGYEVSYDLKKHPTLKSIPVILMWSGFMEIDEPKAQESLADARLEKPFEAAQLRNLVQTLVKKTASNPLAGHLDFPTPPPQKPQEATTKKAAKDPLLELEKIKKESQKFQPKTQAPEPEIEDFEMKSIDGDDHEFDAEETALFKINIPEDGDLDDMPMGVDTMPPIEDMSFLLNPEEAKKERKAEPPTHKEIPAAPAPARAAPAAQPAPAASLPDPKIIEQMVHEKVQDIVEKIAWQLVPEIASQLIKKELERLLKDHDKQP